LRSLFNIYFLVIFLLAGSNLIAQQLNFSNYSLEQGLGQISVRSLYQDSRGYLWVGTAGGGICRFDGKEFTRFSRQEGLQGYIITEIREDRMGNIWFGSSWGGVMKYDGMKVEVIDLNKWKLSNTVNVIEIINDNELLVGVQGNVIIINILSREMRTIPLPKGYEESYIDGVYKVNDNLVYFGTHNGLIKYSNGKLSSVEEFRGKGIIKINRINKDELILIGRENLVMRMNENADPESIVDYQLPKILNSDVTYYWSDGVSTEIILTSRQGMLIKQNGIWTEISDNLGMDGRPLNCILKDKNGVFWIGSENRGLFKYNDIGITTFLQHPVLGSEGIFAIHPYQDDKVLFTDRNLGLVVANKNGVVKSVPIKDKFYAYIMTNDKNGNIYLGGKSILVFDRFLNQINEIPPPEGVDNFRVRGLLMSGDTLFVASATHGLFLYRNNRLIKQFGSEDGGLPSHICVTVTKDKNKRIWVGTNMGLGYYENGRMNFFKDNAKLCNSFCGYLAADNFGRIWIGTDKCIQYIENNQLSEPVFKKDLIQGPIYSLIKDTEGSIWAGTIDGVVKIGMDSTGNPNSYLRFSRSEGFMGIETNSKAACATNDVAVWFGTIKGLHRIDTKLIKKYRTDVKHRIFIERIKLFYETPDWTQLTDSIVMFNNIPLNPKLNHEQNHISFNFKIVNLFDAKESRYSYMLEGLENEWCPPTFDEIASYSNLKPGKYRFLVKAIDSKGNDISNIEEFNFEITEPFWNSWWFILLSALTIVSLSFFILYLYKERKEQEKKLLESLVEIRTSELKRKNEENEILLKEVHHRVKNNLQVVSSLLNIQSSFIEDERTIELIDESINRIKAISIIHERLYKSNDFKNIDLREYLTLLINDIIRAYNVKKNIETDIRLNENYFNLNTLVPLGLLLNEVISNSFKHGFDSEESNSKLYIELNKLPDNRFELIIGDNGKGYSGEDFEKEDPSTLGLQLIKVLTSQLDGTIKKLEKPGVWYELVFRQQDN
jgi:two-component sensor histidine kinase/ligand-binding sensor domain-containing protein